MSLDPVDILLVDDRPDGLLALEAVLSNPEYRLTTARSGPEAIMAVDTRDFAVILLDVQMPLMNGFEAAALIKKRPRAAHIPIIFVTAINKDPRYIHQGYQTGAVDYLFKPFDPEILRSKVAVFVELHRKTRQIEQQAFELKESEDRFRLLLEGVQDYSIFMLDHAGHVVSWSPAAERMKGYSEPEILGEHFSKFYTPEDVDAGRPDHALQTAALEGRYEEEGWRVRRNGDRFFANVILTALRTGDGTLRGFAKVTRDVTDRRRVEDELRKKDQELQHARKLESVGRLAGGVAHDFNNLITGIMGIAEELHSQLDSRDPRRGDLEEILKASNRAFALTRQLLAFGRRQMASPQVLDVNAVVNDLSKMLVRLIGEDVKLVTDLAQEKVKVRMDPSQMEQVMLNLVLNARDAMPTGGNITISTAAEELHAGDGRFAEPVLPGRYVALSVADTGCGMSADMLSQIFEPFFTTKERDKGTGLGLSTVYGIVKQNKGEILVQSEVGKGSRFTIFFPADSEDFVELPLAEKRPESLAGSETVLIVEDEDIVRRVAQNLLKRRGYRVLEAKDGVQAAQLLKQHRDQVDVLVTDIVLPGANGREVVQEAQLLIPDLAVVYMSGYTEDIIANRGILDPGIDFIDKSALAHGLPIKIRQALAKRPGKKTRENFVSGRSA